MTVAASLTQDSPKATRWRSWVELLSSMRFAIALLTVSFQSIKAALMNPVKSLKSE